MKIFTGKINTGAADVALFILRVVSGAAIMTHGYPKLIRLFTERPITFADPIRIGEVPSLMLIVFSELIGGLMIVLGLFTRLAAFALVFSFSVIVFIVKATNTFSERELPVLFLAIFLSILITGPGKYSLDKRIFK